MSAPEGYHTVTPRLFVDDVIATTDFLKATFNAEGELEPGRPVVLLIGDSPVMVSDSSAREAFPAFLYVYVDDADATYARAMVAGAESLEEPLDTP